MYPGDFIITPSWDLARPRQRGDRRRGASPWCGSTASTFRWCASSTRASPRTTERSARTRSRGPKATASRATATTWCRCGTTHARPTSPIFSYPYARSREALAQLQRDEAPDAWQGWKLRYINPLTGGAPMPTIATFLQLLPRGLRAARRQRGTDGAIYSVVEGRGTAEIGGQASPSRPRTPSSCRRGRRCGCRPTRTRCCSASRTARCSRRSACTAKHSSATDARAWPHPLRPRAAPRCC